MRDRPGRRDEEPLGGAEVPPAPPVGRDRETTEVVEDDPGILAEAAIHERVAEFVDEDREQHHGRPDGEVEEQLPLVTAGKRLADAPTDEPGAEPEKAGDPHRHAGDLEVDVKRRLLGFGEHGGGRSEQAVD